MEVLVVAELSAAAHTVALWTYVADDAVLFYQLFAFGEVVDTYCSDVEAARAHGIDGELGGGDAEKLIDATTADALPADVRPLLTGTGLTATERHAGLVRELGLPSYVVATGHRTIEQNAPSESMSPGGLVRTGPRTRSGE